MTAAQTPAIHVRGLEKSYKQLNVLRGVHFDVARGSSYQQDVNRTDGMDECV